MTLGKPRTAVKGVLLDIDGTLVDTTYLHTVSWFESLRQDGHPVTMALIHRAVGMGSDKILDYLLGPDHDADDEVLTAGHSAIFGQYRERLTPLPGAADLLRKFHDLGLKVGLASSASAKDIKALRRALDADDAITAVTGSADAAHSKPDPDILLAALDRLSLTPADVVFIGDAIWDVKAAAALDIECIALESGGTSEAELREAGAVAVYKDPADLLKQVSSSPIVW